MRLIDADALSERMYHDAFEIDSDMQKWEHGCWIRYKMFERAIEDAPTVQPERKDGSWMIEKVYEDEYGIEKFNYFCSECRAPAYEFFQPYCQRCGAKMRGEQHEQNIHC